MTTPGQATAQRARREADTYRVLLAAYLQVARQVVDQGVDALGASALVAAGTRKDPFAYTNIVAAWRSAVRALALSRSDLVPTEVEAMLIAANVPSMLFESVRPVLEEAKAQGWSEYKTKVALNRIVIPKREDDERASTFRAWVRTSARTAATYGYNHEQIEALAQAGYTHKRWVAYHDKKTRPAHAQADGQSVPLVSEFVVGDERLMYPGALNGSPAQTANCRCVIVGSSPSEEDGATLRSMSASASVVDPAFFLSTMVADEAECLPCQGETLAVETEPAQETALVSASWEGCIGVEGELTGDGRYIEPNALRWDTLPLPFRWASADFGAHDGAQVVGRINSVERRAGGVLWGEGDFDLDSEAGREAARQVEQMLTNGVSMDLDDVSFEVRVASDLLSELDEPVDESAAEDAETDDEGRVTVIKVESDAEVFATTSGRIRAATLVSIPAFESARITLVTGESDDAVSSPEPVAAGDAGERGSDAAGAAAADVAPLVASGPAQIATYRPPAAWFADPGFTQRAPLTVTDDGRVYGYLAEWDTCHTSHTAMGQCVLAPRSASGYAYFKTGYVVTREGTEVAVGRLTVGTGHAREHLDAQATMAHYDNTGTVSAFVNIGEDSRGIWVAGALAPGVSEHQKVMLRVTPLSGDWRRINGNLELVAALAVNTAGFPIPRPKGMVASGHLHSLVAAGMVPPTQVLPPGTDGAFSQDDLRYLKRLAQRERDAQVNRVHALALARRVQRSR